KLEWQGHCHKMQMHLRQLTQSSSQRITELEHNQNALTTKLQQYDAKFAIVNKKNGQLHAELQQCTGKNGQLHAELQQYTGSCASMNKKNGEMHAELERVRREHEYIRRDNESLTQSIK